VELVGRLLRAIPPFGAGFVVLKRPADVGAATCGTGLQGTITPVAGASITAFALPELTPQPIFGACPCRAGSNPNSRSWSKKLRRAPTGCTRSSSTARIDRGKFQLLTRFAGLVLWLGLCGTASRRHRLLSDRGVASSICPASIVGEQYDNLCLGVIATTELAGIPRDILGAAALRLSPHRPLRRLLLRSALIWIKIPDANGAKFALGANAQLSKVGNGWRKRLAQSEEVPVERNFSIKVAAVAALAASMMQTAVLKADAQVITASWTCQDVGNGSMEPLGQEGRSFGVFDYVCLATSGPANGGLDTGRTVVVFDKSGGTLVTGTGVIRKPDAMAVYLMTDEKMEFVVSDGKVIGITATGHGRYVMAVGSAASLSGKSFTITQKTTAPHQFSIEEKVE
jgi:hypothetical protein